MSIVDQGLTALGITAVSVEAFSHSDLPDPLPWTYLPGCGQWTPEWMRHAESRPGFGIIGFSS
ncbi:DUF7691 family protein [Streptomyces syringium]|uniref:DUF7691 family protein n=1 Tax=Streptomyces syringium TaxID=76729 RepID=UPI003F53ED37